MRGYEKDEREWIYMNWEEGKEDFENGSWRDKEWRQLSNDTKIRFCDWLEEMKNECAEGIGD